MRLACRGLGPLPELALSPTSAGGLAVDVSGTGGLEEVWAEEGRSPRGVFGDPVAWGMGDDGMALASLTVGGLGTSLIPGGFACTFGGTSDDRLAAPILPEGLVDDLASDGLATHSEAG